MSSLYLLTTITDRNKLARFVTAYQELGLEINNITMGWGTASREMLDLFGLENNEKAVCFTVITDSMWNKVKRCLYYKIHVEVPGIGIAYIVPLSSIGGKRELMMLTENQNFVKEDESTLKNTDTELLIAICNQRYSDLVMDAACAAGAVGGTVLHAKGTGMKNAERFLGISLASEKDIVLIVTKASERRILMNAIMEKAGMNSSAKAIVFSMPVTDTAGLTLLEDNSDKEV